MRPTVRHPLLALLMAPSIAPALEFEPGRLVEAHPGPVPAASATCEVAYFNECTWMWLVWPVETAGETRGVVFDRCGPNAVLDGVWIFQWESQPAGWGYTGYISVYDVDAENSPVEPPLARQPWSQGDQWNYSPIGVSVPERFVVTVEYLGGGIGGVNPIIDYPNENPCIGFRPEPHTYYYGTVDSPLIPGSPAYNSLWGAYELPWRAAMSAPTKIPRESWTSIKTLYK